MLGAEDERSFLSLLPLPQPFKTQTLHFVISSRPKTYKEDMWVCVMIPPCLRCFCVFVFVSAFLEVTWEDQQRGLNGSLSDEGTHPFLGVAGLLVWVCSLPLLIMPCVGFVESWSPQVHPRTKKEKNDLVMPDLY